MKFGEYDRTRPRPMTTPAFPFLLAFFVLAAVAASGKIPPTRMRTGGGTISPSGGYSATAYLDPAPAVLPAPITGAPYSGEEVTESSRTLSDGTRLTQKIPQQRVCRDGQGRTRVERPILRPSPMGPAVDVPPIVEITDPVAGVQYVLDVQNRVAHRSMVTVQTPPATRDAVPVRMKPAAPPGAIRARREPLPATLSRNAEPLGTQEINGVVAEGVRTTQTIPAGTEGYDRDMVLTTETWTSKELRITMLRKTTDPRSGETTFRIQNFSRMEPDIALFLPPPDYEIKDETGPFSITYSKP